VSTQVKATIREFIVSSWLNGDQRGLTDDTDLQESGLLDSLTTLSLVAFLEQSFKILLDPADINAEAFRTLDAVTALVTQKMGAGGAG
jgi:acyl carrier protein